MATSNLQRMEGRKTMANRRHRRPNIRKRMGCLQGRLLARRHTLLAETRSQIVSRNPGRSSVPADLLDMATDSLETEMAFRIAEIRCSEVTQIDDALQRMSEGTYGICESCEARIPAARLRAVPAACMCVSCQATYESGRLQNEEQPAWDRVTDMTWGDACSTRLATAKPGAKI